ncbi:patatin-like phospholipase family protein [Cytophagaceae bacterium ABcell3]|nr:patatin-like phospholipase family protein [Cytophagaceae bacterium ABcell3]
MTNKDFALVLSGGAARCIAQLGILQALEENNIKPAVISGVSGGSIVGAFYCNGYTPKETLQIIKETSILKALRPTWSPGLLKLSKAEEIFRKYLKAETFEALETPLFISACDVENPKNIAFSEGEIIPPLLGSCSLPPLFRAVEYNGKKLADGGIVNNLPVEPVKNYKKIIGVNVNLVKTNIPPDSLVHYTEWVIDVVVNNNIKESIKQCHLFLEPPKMKNFHLIDVMKADDMFEVGYKHANENMDKISKLINSH